MHTIPVPDGPSCSWTTRAGGCRHCGSRFHVTVGQEAPRFCAHCHRAFAVWTADVPASTTTIPAGFVTLDQYERALDRADAEGVRLSPTTIPGTFHVVNRRTHARYIATTRACTCTAYAQGVGCKHRAAIHAAMIAVKGVAALEAVA